MDEKQTEFENATDAGETIAADVAGTKTEAANEPAEPTEKDKDSERITLRDVVNMVLYIAAILVFTWLILTFVGQRTMVSGPSMESTLHDGDNLIVDKLSYRFRDPKRFEIIIFPFKYEEDTYYIKRIIGLPGETVQIDYDGNIWIDGNLLVENYGRERIMNPGDAETPITLGPDEYFVLGDNRNNSTDSRFEEVGPIEGDDIIGRAVVRIYPFNSIRTFSVDE